MSPTAAPPTADATDAVAVADTLRLSATRLARILRRQDPEVLPPTLSSALNSINCDGPLSLGELAQREHVAPPTITRVVEKLKAKGFVECLPDPQDRRVSRVRVSPAGKRHLQRSRSVRTAWLAGVLGDLAPEDLARLAAAAPVLEALVLRTHHPERDQGVGSA
jgi:DNA-binding MarR family transcriptional regulator